MTAQTLPTIEDLMGVQDDLTTMSRKALAKINTTEELGLADEQFTELTPDEIRAHLRLARIEKNGLPVPASTSAEGSWQIEIPVVPMRQLSHDCFVGTISYVDIDKINVDSEVQRPEAKRRIPDIARYVAENDGYFGAVVVTVIGGNEGSVALDENRLIIDNTARIVVNDGQHRIAGIKKAIVDDPESMAERMDDSVPVVVYVDLSKDEQRQLFSDINLHATKPSKAIALDYNHRNVLASFVKDLIAATPFKGRINYLKTRIGAKDSELFTFSALVDAVGSMWEKGDPITPDNYDDRLVEAIDFWKKSWESMESSWTSRNYSTNKNALLAVAKLFGFNVDWTKLASLDWSEGGDLSRVASIAGGTNAAVKALYDEIVQTVVTE